MVVALERSMNKQNKRHRDNKSGVKGITKASKTTWKAQINVDGKTICLGHYPTQSQAADAYWEVAKLHFGEFAKFE
jgi:calcineurin-like phosphoesterase family protein